MVGLIYRNDESMYREEVKHLEGWCRENNLVLNAGKTKEMIINFRRSQHEHAPLSVSGHTVERVENIKCRSRMTQAGIKHLRDHETGPAETVFPEEAETSLSPHQNPQVFRQLCGGERSDVLYLDMVLQLQYVRQKSLAENSERS